jgi:hypothetical protein
MHFRDPNRPEPAGDPRPVTRHRGNGASGDASVDGFTRVARRPYMPRGMGGVDSEIVPNAQADRIEGMFDDIPSFPGD